MMYYVFHNNQLIYQKDQALSTIPDGAYELLHADHTHTYWSFKTKRRLRLIKLKHVPKEIRLLCLVLNIPLT